jgi:oligosaccharide repeat unit polymerase
LGRSYFAASLVPFPFLHRLIMGSELSVAEWRMQTFYPESADTGAFFGFSPVTEAYMNFGSLGVPPMLFLYGFVIGTIYRRVRDRPTPIGVLALAGSVPMFMLNGLTNQASTLMYQWTRVYLMPCLLLALVLAATRKAARSDGSSVELSAEASIASETQ